MPKFTLIWMAPDLDIGCEVYEGEDMDAAIETWNHDTEGCELIGVLEGEPKILLWYP